MFGRRGEVRCTASKAAPIIIITIVVVVEVVVVVVIAGARPHTHTHTHTRHLHEALLPGLALDEAVGVPVDRHLTISHRLAVDPPPAGQLSRATAGELSSRAG